jgi:thiamine pyrophosphokinase
VKIGLVGNGAGGSELFLRRQLEACDQVIAVDGGLIKLGELGITPHLIIGDFDSTPPSLLARFSSIPTYSHPRDKDFSDMELALEEALGRHPDKIILLAATGDRIDHSLANLFLLLKHPELVSIETETETLYAITGIYKHSFRPGQTLSFFSLNGEAKGVTTKGLKWNLQNAKVDSQFYSLSNEVLDEEVEIQIGAGKLLLVIQHV